MSTKKYPIETDEVVWELLLDTIPRSKTINEYFQGIIRREIEQAYTAEYIESNPRFDERHVAVYLELVEECDRIEGDGDGEDDED